MGAKAMGGQHMYMKNPTILIIVGRGGAPVDLTPATAREGARACVSPQLPSAPLSSLLLHALCVAKSILDETVQPALYDRPYDFYY